MQVARTSFDDRYALRPTHFQSEIRNPKSAIESFSPSNRHRSLSALCSCSAPYAISIQNPQSKIQNRTLLTFLPSHLLIFSSSHLLIFLYSALRPMPFQSEIRNPKSAIETRSSPPRRALPLALEFFAALARFAAICDRTAAFAFGDR